MGAVGGRGEEEAAVVEEEGVVWSGGGVLGGVGVVEGEEEVRMLLLWIARREEVAVAHSWHMRRRFDIGRGK